MNTSVAIKILLLSIAQCKLVVSFSPGLTHLWIGSSEQSWESRNNNSFELQQALGYGESTISKENNVNDHNVPQVESISKVNYSHVLSGLDHLYPPDDLSIRNSMSRTDGYWSYISSGDVPPIHLTYGEFDFIFFAHI